MSARLIVACVLAALSCGIGSAAARQPNVVMILADDLGWADTSLYGLHELHQTPHIERLAYRGMRFTNAYAASPVCSPTRNSLLTGLSPARTGMLNAQASKMETILAASLRPKASRDVELLLPISATRIRPAFVTLAERLQSEGYATAHFGKWHLGRPPYMPTKNGFDVASPESYGPQPPGGYFDDSGEHLDDQAAIAAVAFMKENRKRPFFLNFWSFSVHSPYEAKPNFVAAYRRQAAAIGSKKSPTYAAMMQTLDANVGRLLSAIDRFGLADDTIVIFASDNGGTVHLTVDGVPATTNAPLRSGKGTLYEGGVRSCAAISWKGHVEPGSHVAAPMHIVDLYPTLAKLAGANVEPKLPLDGRDVWPCIAEGAPSPHEDILINAEIDRGALRKGDWKLVVYEAAKAGVRERRGTNRPPQDANGKALSARRIELYDLANDVSEAKNVAEAHPGVVADLLARYDRYLSESVPALDLAGKQPLPTPKVWGEVTAK